MVAFKSILDNDLYKFTQQQAVLELFPNVRVEYRFKNRGTQRFSPEFLTILNEHIQKMSELRLSKDEYSWIKREIPFFKPQYLEYLRNYRFKPQEVDISLDEDNDLVLSINGPWASMILWEVPLMALISELYFSTIDTDWNYDDVQVLANEKAKRLFDAGCFFADYGTRRRRFLELQKWNNSIFSSYNDLNYSGSGTNYFVGTSNVMLAMRERVKPIGTMAHEWIQAMQAIEGIAHCNYHALQNWVRVYNSDLGIALTDTLGSDLFFDNFNKRLSKLYDGVRHDSGSPFEFTDKVIKHYQKMGIDPMSKVIIFSDGLDVDKAIAIKKYCVGKIKCSFGIGTHLTNDFENSPALNMVIKLWSVNGFPVVKLSDTEGKENGRKDAVEIVKWIVKNQLEKNQLEKKECPICGNISLVEKKGEFNFTPPPNVNNGKLIIIPNAEWEECEKCKEAILLPELIKELDKYRRMEL